MRDPIPRVVRHAVPTMFAALLSTGAHAGNDSRAAHAPMLPAYVQECTSCHVAYPPGMLPAASWQRLLQNLPRHFGTDASLDPLAAKQLASWLGAAAGTYKRAGEQPPEDRITRSAWFTRKHDAVPATAWKLAAVKSPANCLACHTQADHGDFNDDAVRIPR